MKAARLVLIAFFVFFFPDFARADLSGLSGVPVNQPVAGDIPVQIRQSTVLLTMEHDSLIGLCTGVITGPTTILTAQHCCENTISASARFIAKADGVPSSADIVIDARSAMQVENHDLCILNVKSIPAGFSAVPLATTANKIFYGKSVTVAGFGIPGMDPISKSAETKLNYGYMPVLSKLQTGLFLSVIGLGDALKEFSKDKIFALGNMMFRNKSKLNSSLCPGDSGGPTFYNDNGTLKLLAISSAATRCDDQFSVINIVTDIRSFDPTRFTK